MTNVATLPVEERPGNVQVVQQDFSSQGLLMDFAKINAMQSLAEAMATAAIAVPQHFRGKPGDCLAVVMQAAQWGMNPFAVAQKTHVVNGALGYEAQLVNAVVQASGAIEGRFHYEYRGEGANVECRVGAVIRGERDITWGEWLSAASVTTKNSPLWKTNPKQQLGYLQVKNWARAHTPGAILGVYSTDELEDFPVRDMGAAEVVGDQETKPASNSRTNALKEHLGVGKKKAAPAAPDLAEVIAAISAAETPEAMQAAADMAAKLASDDDKAEAGKRYKARLQELKKATTQSDAPTVTYAAVAERLNKAEDVDLLDVAADFISQVQSPEQQEELRELYHSRRATLTGEQ